MDEIVITEQDGQLDALDRKATDVFPGYMVRKDLVSDVKGGALVPSYVLEYLLSKYATTTDEASIEAGVQRVRAILADNYVHREEANLIQSRIRERGRYSVIDRVQVSLNEKTDQYEATFSNLGISRVIVDPATVKDNPKLLVTGIWCMSTLVYAYSGEKDDVPWRLQRLQPVQMSYDDRDNYTRSRREFTDGEWVDLLMQSMGFNPDQFSERAKMLHLVRMVPFVERNYNLVELGPKGTGKSHIYSEFSPHGMLISGGEVTVAKLFVNNSTGRIGLVGYWDTVAFDEFAGKAKKAGKDLVDIMKNYMANKTFSRGVETLQGEAGMVFVGNTSHTVPYMLKNSDLFEELPAQYHDPAFLDRIHFYVPGWEFDQIRSEMFTDGYGFVVDYLAEILHNLRDIDYSTLYEQYFELSPTLSTRDRDGINKTFSGLMKLLYPDGQAGMEQMEPLLRVAIEGRKRVKDMLCRIDATMEPVEFTYTRKGSDKPIRVETLEEKDYPDLYWRDRHAHTDTAVAGEPAAEPEGRPREESEVEQATAAKVEQATLFTGVREFQADQRGVSYGRLFGAYLKDAVQVTMTDPYIRRGHQMRNLAEFMDLLARNVQDGDQVRFHLVTSQDDPAHLPQQLDNLQYLQNAYGSLGVVFTWEFSDDIHDRWIKTDTGWYIGMGRGLDIYQRYDNDWLNPQTRHQGLRRLSKDFNITYAHNKQ